MNRRATILPILTLMLLSGCLTGERPPLSTIYGDPVTQVPSATGVPMTATTTTTTTTTERVEAFGAPGTTIYYTPMYPNSTGPVPTYQQGGAGPRLPSGQPRYMYPQNDLRCDNALRRCDRWSGPRNRWVPDSTASQAIFPANPAGMGVVIRP